MTGKFNTVCLLLINSFLDIWRFNTVSLLHVNSFYVLGLALLLGLRMSVCCMRLAMSQLCVFFILLGCVLIGCLLQTGLYSVAFSDSHLYLFLKPTYLSLQFVYAEFLLPLHRILLFLVGVRIPDSQLVKVMFHLNG
jgi:hypothetical protein